VFSSPIYKRRNVVERCDGWPNRSRRIGARYEKLATTYHSLIKPVRVRRYIRHIEPSNTTIRRSA